MSTIEKHATKSVTRSGLFVLILCIFLVCVWLCYWPGTSREHIYAYMSKTATGDQNSKSSSDHDLTSIPKEVKVVELTSPEIKCYNYRGNVLRELDDEEPTSGVNIFFHETSCPKAIFDIPLNARQACSIESALQAHPQADVFLLISAPVLVTEQRSRNLLVQKLRTYSNFKIRHINFARYLSNTPMSHLQEKGVLNKSKYPMIHASDILRFTTLYKFAGTYLDLDVMMLKALPNISNYASVESREAVGAGILNFGPDFVGREVARASAELLTSTYDPNAWCYNAPGLITRVLQERCSCKFTDDMVDNVDKCRGFHVYSEKAFMPYPYPQSDLFFKDGETDHFRKIANDSFSIHYWNKLTKSLRMNGSDVPFLKYAQTRCPEIYGTVLNDF